MTEQSPGLSDSEILDRARAERRILVTADKDFGDLVFRQKRASVGVVLLRLAGLSPARKGALVVTSIRAHADEIPAAFTVVSAGGIRIRPGRHP